MNKIGNAISLVQQGTQTARNKNIKIGRNIIQSRVWPKAMMIWNRDAHVLSNTWPECGNLVVGFMKAIIIPMNAAEFVSNGSSIKPI